MKIEQLDDQEGEKNEKRELSISNSLCLIFNGK